MSSQRSNQIPFSLAKDQVNFRLLELPEELLTLLTSDNAPMLQIKSKGTPGSRNDQASSPSPSFAVLCTDDKTFQIRQVQTSNSVYVIQPIVVQTEEDQLPVDGICAIASCPATLELSPSKGSPESDLRQLLVEWDGDNTTNTHGCSRSEIEQNIPFSRIEIAIEWTKFCAFEWQGVSYIPQVQALLGVWKSIVLASEAEDINLIASSQSNAAFWNGFAQDEGLPLALIEAIKARIALPSADQGQDISAWIAHLLLLSSTTSVEDRLEFLASWKASLPEKWKDQYAKFDLIQDITDQSDPMSISLKQNYRVKSTTIGSTSTARKWHDKFKKTR